MAKREESPLPSEPSTSPCCFDLITGTNTEDLADRCEGGINFGTLYRRAFLKFGGKRKDQ